MLRDRILTALILIPVFLAIVLLLPAKHFAIVTGILVIVSAWEWSYLMGVKRFPKNILYPFFMIIFLVLTIYLLYRHIVSVPMILSAAFIFWLLATVLVISYPKISAIWGKSILLRAIMGIMVLIPCLVAINFIRIFPFGTAILLFLFVIIWGADSGAYFVGRKWGKSKLAPLVSPGKSWQGLIGALLTTIIIVLAASLGFQLPYSLWGPLLLLALITVVFSVIGDLFESMLKRNEGLKDSSQLLPGHGGILDRIDSLTAAAPIFALGAMWLGK